MYRIRTLLTISGILQDSIKQNYMHSYFSVKLTTRQGSYIGIGNIKIETAKRIYETNKQGFGKKLNNWSELVDYLRTPCGSVHIASLVIRKGQSLLANYINTYSQDMKEAVLVTYYTQSVLDLGFKCPSYFIHSKAK